MRILVKLQRIKAKGCDTREQVDFSRKIDLMGKKSHIIKQGFKERQLFQIYQNLLAITCRKFQFSQRKCHDFPNRSVKVLVACPTIKNVWPEKESKFKNLSLKNHEI